MRVDSIAILTLCTISGVWIYARGIRAFIARRPVFFPSRWITGVIYGLATFTLLTRFTSVFVLHLRSIELFVALPFFVLASILVMVYSWYRWRGYGIMGVAGMSFVNSLRHSLEKLNLEYEQPNNYDFHIKSLKADLVVNVADWTSLGSMHFKQKAKENNDIMERLVDELRIYYQDEDFGLNFRALIACIVLGTLPIVLGVGAYFLFEYVLENQAINRLYALHLI